MPLEAYPSVFAAPSLLCLISLSSRPIRIPFLTSSDTAAGQIALRNLLYFQKNTNASFLNFRSFQQLQTPGGIAHFPKMDGCGLYLEAPLAPPPLVAQSFLAVHASQLPASSLVKTHRTRGNLTCAMSRLLARLWLCSLAPSPTPSVTNGATVSLTTKPQPLLG